MPTARRTTADSSSPAEVVQAEPATLTVAVYDDNQPGYTLFCTEEHYAQNLKVDFSRHVKQDDNRKVDYVPWHRMYAYLCANTPFRLKYYTWTDIDPTDPSRGTLIECVLVNTLNGVESPKLYNAVMAKNKMNSAVDEANSRQIGDAMQRALVKAIAMHTGLGFELWMKLEEQLEEEEEEDFDDEDLDDEDDEDEEDDEPVPRRTRRRAVSNPAPAGRTRRTRRG